MNGKLFLVPIMAAFVYSTTYSQTNQKDSSSTAQSLVERKPPFANQHDGFNMVKLNLSTFAFKGLGIQYERKIGRRTSIALGISFIPTSTVSFKSQLEKTINNPQVNVDQFKLGTTIITPELKYYFGTKGAFHGFYLAPYMRLGRYHIEGPVTYNSSTDSIRTAVFNGNMQFFSGGVLMGSSFQLSNSMYLDWWILGLGFGAASGNVSAATPLKPDEQESLKKQLNDANIPMTSTTNQVDAHGATVTSSGSVIGLRGFGINIGIRF